MTNPSSQPLISTLSMPMLENPPPFNYRLTGSKKIPKIQPWAYLSSESLYLLPPHPFSEPLKRHSKKFVNAERKSLDEQRSLTHYFHQNLRLRISCSKSGIQLNSLLANAPSVSHETTVRDFLHFLFCFNRKSFKECLINIILSNSSSFSKILPKFAQMDAKLVQELIKRLNNISLFQFYNDLLQLYTLIQNFDDRCDFVKILFSLPTHLGRKHLLNDFSSLFRFPLPFPFFLSLGLVDPLFIQFLRSLDSKIILHFLTENHHYSPKKIKALHFTLLCTVHSTPQQFGYKEIFEKHFPLFGQCDPLVNLESLWIDFKNDLLNVLPESQPYKPENIDFTYSGNPTPNQTYDLYLDHFVREHQATLMKFKRYFDGKGPCRISPFLRTYLNFFEVL